MTYIPVNGEPFAVSMGLRAMDPDNWIEIDEHFEAEISEKRELLAHRHNDVFGALEAGRTGSNEVLTKLINFLPRRFPERYANEIEIDPSVHPLEAASLLVQEDLAIMSPVEGQWVLTAASLCFPSRWNLQEKLGRNLHDIHGPVPDYERRVGYATDAMFNKFTPDRPVWRVNWTVIDKPDLFQPESAGANPRTQRCVDLETFANTTYFRTERQTLWALDSGDVLFTIRTYVHSLADLDSKYPEFREQLRGTISGASPELKAYKGWEPIWADLMDWTAGRG